MKRSQRFERVKSKEDALSFLFYFPSPKKLYDLVKKNGDEVYDDEIGQAIEDAFYLLQDALRAMADKRIAAARRQDDSAEANDE